METSKSDSNKKNKERESTQKTRKKRKTYQKKRVIIPIITSILFLLFGIYSIIYAYHYQTTDDAYIEGRLVAIAPKVAGHVTRLCIDDNKEVKKGQLLLEIDPKDYKAALHQAQGKLDEAKASLTVAERTVEQNQSIINQFSQELKSSSSKLQFAQKDYDRYSKMYGIGVSSKQEFDQSSTLLQVSKSTHKSSSDKLNEARIALKVAQAKKDETLAEIEKAKAELDQAELNLSYTKIYAPQSGSIASRSVEQGNYVQVGQSLMAVIPQKMWIVANFKETQLTHMQKGQKVNIHIDTYPSKPFKGHVDSIQRATGAKSSLFPPENAVGSYVKIVQRVPVKIVFDEDYSKYNIVPGMSVTPKVKVR